MNAVRTFNSKNQMVYNEDFRTAEQAYEHYCECIRILKARLPKGEEITITRWSDNMIMTMETIIGAN